MGTGGSRFGAGRPAQHVKAEHCRKLDVRHWQREGALRPGCGGVWTWTNRETGERLASIGYQVEADRVVLDYSVSGEPRKQDIWLTETACNYGGTRQWFTCPIRGERVAVLYLRTGRFACRKCQRIDYASQSGDQIDRTWRKQAKVEAKLGPNWERLKGMHEATHQRLVSIIWECEERRDTALTGYLDALMLRHPCLRSDPLLK